MVACRNLSEGIAAGCATLGISPQQARVRIVERHRPGEGSSLVLEVCRAGPGEAGAVGAAVASASAQQPAARPSPQRVATAPWYKIEVSDDGLAASLILYGSPSGEPGTVPTADQVRQALTEAGVVFGYDEEAIASALALFVPGRKSVVARGLPPRNGTGSRLQLALGDDPVLQTGPPPPDGPERHRLARRAGVVEGQLLATILPPDSGDDGYAVTGHRLPAQPPGPATWSAGVNTRVSEDGQEIRAATSGVLCYENGTISVEAVLRIPGDVDSTSGSISSPGSIVVEGNVQPGSAVTAGGDLLVLGLAEGATLEAGGNLTVRQGFKGGGKGRAKAGGILAARFLENVSAEAGADVVAEAILSSRVVSKSRILCLEGRGLVAGGSVRAKDEVVAKVLGSPLQVTTEIEVGNDPAVRERLGQVSEQIREGEATLPKIEQALVILREGVQRGTLSDGHKATYMRLARQRLDLLRRQQELTVEKKSLEEQAARMKRGRVIARDALHPGVRLVLGKATWESKDTRPGCTLTLDEDDLVECGPAPDAVRP